MPVQTLIMASPDNHLMDKVITDWDRQLAALRLPKTALDGMRNYEGQLKPDKRYGVYVLCTPDGHGGGRAPYDAFVHMNHQWPSSSRPYLEPVSATI